MAGRFLDQLTKVEMNTFFNSYDTVFIFCEGVLVEGRDGEISGSLEAVDALKKRDKRVIYFSRDCSLSRAEICKNMTKANHPVTPDDVVCLASLMARYLKKRLDEKRKVYVIGSPGISEELDHVGLPNFGIGPDYLTTDLATFVHSYKDDPEMGAVLVAFDEYFSYPKMLRAASYLSVKDVLHLATTKRDNVTAALVACIETCSDKEALVFDTSASVINNILLQDYRIIPERTLLIAPSRNDNILLASFQLFSQRLSSDDDRKASFFELSSRLDESPEQFHFYAESLAQVAACLKS